MIINFKKVKFGILLNRACPLNFKKKSAEESKKVSQEANNGYETQDETLHKGDSDEFPESFRDLQRYFTPNFQVSNFLKAVCRKVIPASMWGSYHNLITLFKSILNVSLFKLH